MTRPVPRHFIDIADIAPGDLRAILDLARHIKSRRNARTRFPGRSGPLAGKVLALYFEQPSTRTRISFDLAMRETGGHTLLLSPAELQITRGESVEDTARVLSRYVDALMIRALDHDMVRAFAANGDIPVINGLTRHSHPCQIVADLMTFEEHRGPVAGRKFAWIGDINNVAISLVEAATALCFHVSLACPADLEVAPHFRARLARHGGAHSLTEDPAGAASGADCVVTDVWRSLGADDSPDEAARLAAMFAPFQVNGALMARAAPDALFMHCLPAHRGEEVAASVIDGAQSVVFDEAENRLHAQKAILHWCFHAGAA